MITDDFIIESIDRPLKTALVALKPDFVKLTQQIYDQWTGGMGICDIIERKIQQFIDENIPNVHTSQQTKQFLHYWTRVWSDKECYDIDIPFGKYETYNYKTKEFEKIPNVIFTTRDIFIYRSTHSSLKTPWDLKKSYVPNRSDKYYTSESLDLSLVTVKSKKSPIIRNGWLLPDGKFIPLSIYIRSHNELAKQMGFAGYYDAYDYGCVRVSIMPSGKYYMETTQPMNDKLYSLLTSAIKRMKDVVDVSIWVGEGSSFQKVEWDGREIVSLKNRVYESPDFGYRQFNNRDEDIAKLKWIVDAEKYELKVRAVDPNRDYSSSPRIYGPYEGLIIGRADKDNGIQVTLSRITCFNGFERNWQSTGLGQLLYDHFIAAAKKYGFKAVRSDYTLSGDARKAWAKLAKRYKVNRVKDEEGDKRFEIDLRGNDMINTKPGV